MAALDDEDRQHVMTWSDLNPEYRHEVLTDEMMDDYVKDHFHLSHPDVEEIYFDVKDYILRSDMIRYLLLLADGGVYNDLDVGCEKPINTWVPAQYKENAGVVLGVEVDNKFGPDGRTFQGGQDLFQLVNWTIMSKPNQPFMWFLVTRVMDNIKRLAASLNQPISKIEYSIQDVLDVTGPAALTRAFFDYASDITDSNVTYHNFTKMTKPRLIGEVVILPIHAFGAGHQVEWAGWKQDGSELIHHYFAGSWKTDHHDGPSHVLSVDEEQKKKEQDAAKAEEAKQKQAAEEAMKKAEEEKKKAEEEKKKAEEEKKKQNEAMAQDEADRAAQGKGDTKSENSASNEEQYLSKSKTNSHSKAKEDQEDKSLSDEDGAKQDSAEDSASGKPASVQNTSEGDNDKPETEESMAEKVEKVKAEKEAKEKEKARKEKEEKKKEAEAEAEAEAKAKLEEEAAEAKKEEEKKAEMTDEEKEEEDRKQKWEEVKAAAPKTMRPKSDEEKQKSSNNLADYDYQPD